ncbi:MAG: hypothetical protein GF317_02210 [Candidatus Lokiarchaeota archaeon]|nr:hypothetical protein [Candidatus Lokiarchaeota archaeon]
MNKKIFNYFTLNILISVFIFFTLFSTINVSCHPASDMILSYNLENQVLSVKINHFVSNSKTHYIDNVTISKNDDIVHILNYTSQPSNSNFTYTYSVNASTGDEIEVFTHCNLGGSLTKKLTVSKQNSNKDTFGLSFQELSYYSIFGLPLIVYLGLITLGLFLGTAALPILKQKNIVNTSVKWHIWLAYVAIVFALIHSILGLLIYL